jgi:hypothetical protein
MMRSAERKLQMVAINYDDLSLAFDFVSSGPPGQDLLELRSVLERLQTSREWR